MTLVKYWVGKPHIFTAPSPGNEQVYVPLYKAEDVALLLDEQWDHHFHLGNTQARLAIEAIQKLLELEP